MSPRMVDLVQAAAQTLDQGGIPFSDNWLTEHAVTFTEALDLASNLALVLHGFLQVSPVQQMYIIQAGLQKISH
jgi:hypothetical protein